MTTSMLTLALLFLLMKYLEAWLPSHDRQQQHTRSINSCSKKVKSIATAILASSNDEATSGEEQENTFLVEVTYQGRSCKVSINANETLLAGLERARVPDQLAIPELPSECRRGNCLTCVGRHSSNSQESSVRRGEDGLSPFMSRQTLQSGYILTCSSYVTGDGLKLELGENHRAWADLYQDRLYDESTQYVARKAMARTIRRSDEQNPERWAVETKIALDKSGE